jgi:YidC/Oxa1 family membrane protein insertase
MESRRFLLAIVLMIVTVVIVNVLFPPVRRPPAATPADSARAQPPSSAPAAQPTTPPAALPAPATASAAVGAVVDTIVVQSDLFRYGISTQGGTLVSAELLKYESQTRPGPVQLAPTAARGLISYRLRADGQTMDLSGITFTPDRNTDLFLGAGADQGSLKLTGTDAATGRTVELTYTFRRDDYVIDVVARMSAAPRGSQLLLDLGPTLAFNDANKIEDRRALAFVVNSRKEGIQSVPFASLRGATRIAEGPLSWVALKNKYFLVAALPSSTFPDASFGGLVAEDVPGADLVNLTATLPFTGENSAEARFYVGPQEYDRLVALGQQLQDVNPYGWRWLRPVIRPLGHAFTWILLQMHRVTGLAYGWVLILFGIGVRIALWPLNAKAMRSQMKNMELQPRIKDIQTRLKNNPEQMQKEMLKLYREEGFNPMGGCLPLLLPMPVLITLFFVFQSTIEFRGESFLWLPDLSQRDPLYILPILLGVTMFIQQYLSMRGSPPNPQMQMMMWFMPAFMVILFLNFASGLNLYYSAQNIASFPQQLQLMKERQKAQGNKKVAVAK